MPIASALSFDFDLFHGGNNDAMSARRTPRTGYVAQIETVAISHIVGIFWKWWTSAE
jgi:hypothetical protein